MSPSWRRRCGKLGLRVCLVAGGGCLVVSWALLLRRFSCATAPSEVPLRSLTSSQVVSVGGGDVDPKESSSWVGGRAGFLPRRWSVASIWAQGWVTLPADGAVPFHPGREGRWSLYGGRGRSQFDSVQPYCGRRWRDLPPSMCSLCVHYLPPCQWCFAWWLRTSTIKRRLLLILVCLVCLMSCKMIIQHLVCNTPVFDNHFSIKHAFGLSISIFIWFIKS